MADGEVAPLKQLAGYRPHFGYIDASALHHPNEIAAEALAAAIYRTVFQSGRVSEFQQAMLEWARATFK